MRPFDYTVADDVDDALAAVAAAPAATRFVAGGTNLLDLMKAFAMRPAHLVDLNRIGGLDRIEALPDGGLRLGALARNADTAYHPLVRERQPLISAALLAGASPQIRNMATNGGNLLQRTRCAYFYDAGVPCNKRDPGSGCPAIGGVSRHLAILGTSEHCIATHPSDFCVALAALDAVVQVRSQRGARTIPFADFHRLPGDRPDVDTTLAPDELILHLDVPANRFARHVTYLKVRERQSYAFALVSVAAALELDADGTIREARIALGGVAHKPWRDTGAEALLRGGPADGAAFEAVAAHIVQDARGHGLAPMGNAYKVPMARRAIVRALEMARDGELTNTGEDAKRAEALA